MPFGLFKKTTQVKQPTVKKKSQAEEDKRSVAFEELQVGGCD